MKRIAVIFILALIPLLVSCASAQKPANGSPPTMSASMPISVDQGLKIIQKLFPDDCDGIQFVSMDKIASVGEMLFRSGAARFWVNVETGAVDSFQLTNPADSGKSALLLEDARAAAKAYIQKYRPDMDLSVMTPTVGKLLDHGGGLKEYEFEWRKYKNGVDIGTYAMAMLTPDGVLKSFSACNNDAHTPDLTRIQDSGEKKAVQKIVWPKNNRLTWAV